MSVQHLSFKNFTSDDMQNTTTLLHENIPITGTLVSGTYATSSTTSRGLNIKSYSHGMFQSVYDYPYLSSSANHIIDISAGFSSDASSISSSAITQVSKKVNIYNQMAQVLVGYDTSSVVRRFDADGDFSDGAEKMDQVFFLNFSRLLTKDEIKKGSFEITLGTDATHSTAMNTTLQVSDSPGDNFRSNSPVGEYGFLKNGGTTYGLVYYQAGVAVLTSSVFGAAAQILNNATSSSEDVLISSSIDEYADGVRHRINNISFNNTTELNSSIYSCKVGHNDFNYSSNPTYLNNSKIVVKTDAGVSNEKKLPPVSYITTIGLYSANNELMAVAKLSEPLRNDPTVTANLRVRLDF